ncbi:putative YSIRK family gram-positive signal peptide [Zalerion maritima]|uniref:YSIRK family gram-positive signal peptide n=1 Tax=Zalerion maritima TaxID=339359 RepID=A0AAD5WUA6_9PEZI|nr:putative YSIRK family gram-positive signal peptide [Zalerion maritima]
MDAKPGEAPNPPLASEPRHVLVVLQPEQRETLHQLVSDITVHMQQGLDLLDAPEVDRKRQDAESPPEVQSSLDKATAKARKESGSIRAAASPALSKLREAAKEDMRKWNRKLLSKLKDLLSSKDDKTVLEARQKREETQGDSFPPTSFDVHGDGPFESPSEREEAIARTRNLYHPLDTSLRTLPSRDKEEVLSALLLQCLADGNYVAYDRVMLCHFASSLEIPLSALMREEAAIAETLINSQAQMKADEESQEKRKHEGKVSRYWKVGLASAAGAALIGVTAGLAAPAVAGALGGILGGIGLGSVSSFLGVFWMNGALVGTLFGVYGAKLGGKSMDAYAKEVEDFSFLPVETDGKNSAIDKEQPVTEKPKPRLRLTIGINGLITKPEDTTSPWEFIPPDTEVHALQYEQNALLELGKTLNSIIKTVAWKVVCSEVLQRTVLATLSTALWPPFMISSAASNLDNPFSRAKNRSDKAGKVLADALEARVQGQRPVTLIGFSLGARVVANCLKQLAEKNVFGVIEDVILIGAPVPSDAAYWAMMKTVASGRVVNVFSSRDLVLAFLYRASSVQLGIAGLYEIKGVPQVDNLNLSNEVSGHQKYMEEMGKILTRCGFEGIADGLGEIEGNEPIVVNDEAMRDDQLDVQDKGVSESAKDLEALKIGENTTSTPVATGDDILGHPDSLTPPPQEPGTKELGRKQEEK